MSTMIVNAQRSRLQALQFFFANRRFAERCVFCFLQRQVLSLIEVLHRSIFVGQYGVYEDSRSGGFSVFYSVKSRR